MTTSDSPLSDVAILAGIALVMWAFSPATAPSGALPSRALPAAHTIDPQAITFTVNVPKIGAHAAVITQVDPANPAIYEEALTRGVAQAKGTAFPEESGNMFLFAHSTATAQLAAQYNAVFYLLFQLEAGDRIEVRHGNNVYLYQVTGKKIVEPTAVSYLAKESVKKTLTLMTCYPPGDSAHRLLIFAEQVKIAPVTSD